MTWCGAVRLGAFLVCGGGCSMGSAGCARYDYELGALPPIQGGGTGGSAGSAGVEEREPFSEPELLTVLSDPEALDDDPALTADLLEIYFSSERDGGLGESDIWRSVRPSVDAQWDVPVHVPELSSTAFDTSVALAADGLSIWISSNREGGVGGTDIWVSQRPDRQSSWSDPVLETALSSAGDEITRYVSEARALLAARPIDTEPYDLYMVERSETDGYGARTALAELNTVDNESDAFLVGEHTLYFTSSRAGSEMDDLYIARRAFADEPFGNIESLAELNSPANDGDPWVASDERWIVFASERENEQFDIYEARR
jgi:hypothetical protein